MKLEIVNVLFIYGITAATFFLIDLLWIGVIAKGFYAKFIGSMMADRVNWAAALTFYLIYIGGIVLFVLIPALKNGSGVLHVMVMGGLLGLFAYSTFDLTALALFKDWPFIVTVVDMAWGMLLTAGTAAVTLWIIQNVLKTNWMSG
jgi:uncharacterized membrane protein